MARLLHGRKRVVIVVQRGLLLLVVDVLVGLDLVELHHDVVVLGHGVTPSFFFV